MREAVIKLNADADQRALIRFAARVAGKSKSAFILEAACERAQAELLDDLFFRASGAKVRDFHKFLDTPHARDVRCTRPATPVSTRHNVAR